VPEAPPREVSCLPKSPETIQVQWQPPPDSLVHGDIQGYRIIYHPEPNGQDDDLGLCDLTIFRDNLNSSYSYSKRT